MTNPLNFGQVAIDAADAGALAGFYSRLLERPVGDDASPYFATIPGDRSFPTIIFLKVPEERAGKNRIHLDFLANDPAPHVERALELGAAHAGEFDEYGTQWTTLSDPEGNVFDIGLLHRD